jgi:hypothetical protein
MAASPEQLRAHPEYWTRFHPYHHASHGDRRRLRLHRQVTGAQSAIDLSVGDFGVNTLGIPGTNGPGSNYVGQPQFSFTGFSALGNSNGGNPFLFRDNQFTTDVNLSWTLGKHATKYGFTYYHFDLNHFQPTGEVESIIHAADSSSRAA